MEKYFRFKYVKYLVYVYIFIVLNYKGINYIVFNMVNGI